MIACETSAKERRITVYAATSCWTALEEIRKIYKTMHPESAIVIAYGASGNLAQQIVNGAPADIIITANTHWTKWLQKQDTLLSQEPFVANRLALITYLGSPYNAINSKPNNAPLASLQDSFHRLLSTDGERFALANPALSPVGSYGRQVLENLGIWDPIQKHLLWGQDVGNVMTWIRLEVAELGIVYSTDLPALSNGRLLTLIPANLHAPVAYHVGLLKKASPQGKTFYTFLRKHGKRIFYKAGFLPIKSNRDG